MTKDEYINLYIQHGRIDPSYRTENGVRCEGGRERIAIPCDCGGEECCGWMMILNTPEEIAIYSRMFHRGSIH